MKLQVKHEFIAKDNKTAANKMMELFYKTFKMFLRHPKIGNSRPDFTYLDVKFYVIKKNYLVVYRIIDNKILRILRVLTTYQDVCSEL